MSRLIGLGGYARSGKDAIAAILERHGWYRTFMSKPLHQAMLALDPYIPQGAIAPVLHRYSGLVAVLGYDETKARFPEVRRLLQVLGTEVGRGILGEDAWIDTIEEELGDAWAADPSRPQVVTGIRFPNEIARIRYLGGELIWVERPGFGPTNGHASETTLGPHDFDEVLHNCEDLAGLERRVRNQITLGQPT